MTLEKESKLVQWYKQRFELLCYETNFPAQVWGEEFYKGLCPPIKDKLACIANLDHQNYRMLTHHAIQLDENYLARQREKLAERQQQNQHYTPIKNQTSVVIPTPMISNYSIIQKNTDSNNRITKEVRDFRKANNLCMFDGGNHKTHLCQKLIDKCLKEGKALPVDPSTKQSERQQND